ncbi:M14 family metallopeptidase [Massilia sp.]|uniref:M14 family metallopeptidase n=1 Tax=Massilia sp. TaxID=1882437 RepID=UPI00289A7077|nr:M14 family metallopeptidase [Massilia sp.]
MSKFASLLAIALLSIPPATCAAAPAPASGLPLPDLLPPAQPWNGASEKLVVPAGERWATPIEKSDFQDSPDAAGTLAFLRAMDAQSSLISLHGFGKSYQGRELVYALAKKPGAGKPVVMIQAGIHAGEIDGKDAGLMLLRDIAFRGRDDLLDLVDIVFIPILNVDAHENASPFGRPNMRGLRVKGARTNAQGLDLNRDYARLQSPEIAAVVALLRRFDPALYIDVHVSDGTDYQYDITYTFAGWGSYARSRATAGWLMNDYSADVDAALTAQGHVPGVYPSWIDQDQPAKGLRISAEGPRYSTGYGDFAGIPTVLVENHTMKPYKRRVLGTYVLLEQSIRTVARERERIARAKAEDRAARPARLLVGWERDPEPLATRDFKGYRYDRYDSKASGTSELRWTGEPVAIGLPVYGVRPTREIDFPRAWWIRPEQTDMIATLRAHGVQMETLAEACTLPLETVGFASGKERANPRVSVQPVALPAGAVRISSDQAGRALAAALLAPESDDSFLAQGYFDQALPPESRLPRHLLAPLADRMMQNDPALRERFAQALAADRALAADPQARLRWWLERSDYFERSLFTYPVFRERSAAACRFAGR